MESMINANGTINNEVMEDKNMENNYGEVVVNDDIMLDEDLFSQVSGAAVAAKYSNLPSFFEGKNLVKTTMWCTGREFKICDAMYGKYKDGSKPDFAAVQFEDTDDFAFVNREALDFIRRLVDICKANKLSMKNLLSKMTVTIKVTKMMRKGHEEEDFGVLEDGTNNWFYKYEMNVTK